jgi:hypothetical protein
MAIAGLVLGYVVIAGLALLVFIPVLQGSSTP